MSSHVRVRAGMLIRNKSNFMSLDRYHHLEYITSTCTMLVKHTFLPVKMREEKNFNVTKFNSFRNNIGRDAKHMSCFSTFNFINMSGNLCFFIVLTFEPV